MASTVDTNNNNDGGLERMTEEKFEREWAQFESKQQGMNIDIEGNGINVAPLLNLLPWCAQPPHWQDLSLLSLLLTIAHSTANPGNATGTTSCYIELCSPM